MICPFCLKQVSVLNPVKYGLRTVEACNDCKKKNKLEGALIYTRNGFVYPRYISDIKL